MTRLEQQVRSCQQRLWLNGWLHYASWCVAGAGGLFALTVFVQRLFDAPLPLDRLALLLAGAAVLGSAAWTSIRRPDAATAAAKLDEAAGLRERVSSGLYCLNSDDPFAQAVVADAERIGSSVNVRQHLRLRFPQPFGWAVGCAVLSLLMFLVPVGLLKPTEAKEASRDEAEREQVRAVVRRQLDPIKQLAETTPALAEMSQDLEGVEKSAGGRIQRPADIRHEAIKKIDRIEDAVKQKLAGEKYDTLPALRKMLRNVQSPNSADGATQKLSEALHKGDFKTAKEEVEKLREQLATLKSDQDKELAEKMSKQLADLAKQLEKAALDEKLAQQLQQLGIKKEDIERMLERLSKTDLDQLRKQLEEKGLNQQQIEKIAKQLDQRQQGGSLAKKLAGAMRKGSQGNQPGQMSDAIAGLTDAAQQLSELEQLEQEMNQLESAASALQQARQGLDKQCPS